MRYPSFAALSGAVLWLGTVAAAHATVKVSIDLTHQRMYVDSNEGSYDWPISSARSGFYTPGGSFAPTHLERMHYSRKYHMSPMPYSIFFRGGYAIHGSYETGSLGRPASHGCVRLAPSHAAMLYSMVQAEGARISISGTPPASRSYIARASRRPASERTYGAGPEDGYADVPYASSRPDQRAYGSYGVAPGYGYGYPYGYGGYGYVPQQAYGYSSGF